MADAQPWLANPEWAQKRISGTISANVKMAQGIWLSGALALALGGAGLFLDGSKAWNQKNPLGIALLIFPLAGIALVYWSALLKLRARRYAGTYFQMESLPFLVGEKLRGTVHAPLGDFKGPVRVRLNCVRRTRLRTDTFGAGAGGSKTTWDELVWRQEQSVPVSGRGADAKWATIETEFAIPGDAPTTDSANPDDRILWTLEVSAKLWGTDLKQYFEVPVFTRLGVSARPGHGDPNIYAPIGVSLAPQPLSSDRQVVERISADGGAEFVFLARRHWGIAKFATIAFCVWTAVIRYFLWGSDAYALTLFVIGDLLLVYWALWGWCGRSSAKFENGTVTVRQSLFGIGRSKKVPYNDIRQVTSPIASQSGQGTEAIPRYAIYLETLTGETVMVATGLKNAGEAAYIAEKFKAEIGLRH